MSENKLYHSIGEVAEMFGEEVSTIRYWEKEFSILKPKKNKRGVRLFTNVDIKNLRLIHHYLREKKLTIAGAIRKLNTTGEKTEAYLEIVEKLRSVKHRLETIKKEMK